MNDSAAAIAKKRLWEAHQDIESVLSSLDQYTRIKICHASLDHAVEAGRAAAKREAYVDSDRNRAAITPAKPETCLWQSEPEDVWVTCCKKTEWVFPEGGTPKEHGMRFCPFCGSPLRQTSYREGAP